MWKPDRWVAAHGPTRDDVYNRMPAVPLDLDARPTTETRRQADELFGKIKKASNFKQSKIADKQNDCALLLHAAKAARYKGGVIRYSRKLPKRTLQVIDAAIELGMAEDYRSPPGSPRQSRLRPLGALVRQMEADPWRFDPPAVTQYVFLRKRRTEEDIPFDPNDPSPRCVQMQLERINLVNALSVIEHDLWSEWEQAFAGVRQLRPVHFAVFTDTFAQHGRLYTGRHGHQSLSKLERSTIRFAGEPGVELDYGGMHPRIIYHLEGMAYEDDPYALWGARTTPPMRLMAKYAVNALINAAGPAAAVSACNYKMRMKNKQGGWKRGKALAEAQRLHEAAQKTGLKFQQVCGLAQRRHRAIAHRFGCDLGMRLMWVDSAIALDVLFHFARQCIPCLSCHDSFIVPAYAAGDLRAAMGRFYEQRLGFLPAVKPAK